MRFEAKFTKCHMSTQKDAKRSMADEEDVVFEVVILANDSLFIGSHLCE